MKQYFIIIATTLCIVACGSDNKNDENIISDEFNPVAIAEDELTTNDLHHYELVGPVKASRKVTYYDVFDNDGVFEPDTSSTNRIETVAYFDEDGGYVAKQDERIKRDEQGRITRWEDRHPNYPSIHPGFLRDSLSYKFISPNVTRVHGKNMLNVIVTDDMGNILSQQIHSVSPKYDSSASNVYRKYDDHGNWTERLTVWTTATKGDSIPSIRYSIDKRKIVYY